MFIGYILRNRKIIDDKFTDTLSLLLVKIIFPALIFTKIISHFNFSAYAYWWILPILAIVLSLLGMAIGYFVYSFINGNAVRKEFMCSCGFQNCGYLPMNLILFAFSGALADRFLVYTFLFIIGFNLIIWSLVPIFLEGNMKKGFKLSLFLNPPIIATLLSILWVLFAGKNHFPIILFEPLRLLGQAAFPIAMITLGAYLARYRAYDLEYDMRRNVIAACISKLLILPAVILILLKWLPIAVDYKFFLFLQGIMPVAVSLVVIGSYSGADNKFLSSTIFYSHLIAIFSIPLWFAFFKFVMLG